MSVQTFYPTVAWGLAATALFRGPALREDALTELVTNLGKKFAEQFGKHVEGTEEFIAQVLKTPSQEATVTALLATKFFQSMRFADPHPLEETARGAMAAQAVKSAREHFQVQLSPADEEALKNWYANHVVHWLPEDQVKNYQPPSSEDTQATRAKLGKEIFAKGKSGELTQQQLETMITLAKTVLGQSADPATLSLLGRYVDLFAKHEDPKAAMEDITGKLAQAMSIIFPQPQG